MKISIIGGGRWARTIASVLCGLPGRSDMLTMHSPGNAAGLQAWAAQPQFGGRIRAVAAWPALAAGLERPDAVIVANRVGEHFQAAEGALLNGIPVMVEKPVAPSRELIEALRKVATSGGAALGASHVFLFARYLEAFAASVATLGKGRGLSLVWTDGAEDVRRGEAKSYDPAVTVFDDVLPHIVPMVGAVRFRDLELVSIDVQRGGARMAIEARADGRRVSLLIARNDTGRRRRIEVDADKPAALDFADEPGVIDIAGKQVNGDPQWDTALRPLGAMLSKFVASAEGGPRDPRLSPELAVASAALADAVRARYVAHQVEWLTQRIGQPLDADLQYALAEFASSAAGTVDIVKVWPSITSAAELKSLLSRSPLYADNGLA